MDKCPTCRNQPIWGCHFLDTCGEGSCFVICPECGKEGFGSPPENFTPDMELAAMVQSELNKFKENTHGIVQPQYV